MDEEEAVFEQLTLSDLKKWSSAGLGVFNYYVRGEGVHLNIRVWEQGEWVAHSPNVCI